MEWVLSPAPEGTDCANTLISEAQLPKLREQLSAVLSSLVCMAALGY